MKVRLESNTAPFRMTHTSPRVSGVYQQAQKALYESPSVRNPSFDEQQFATGNLRSASRNPVIQPEAQMMASPLDKFYHT